MLIKSRNVHYMDDNTKISVVEFNTGEFELAILYRNSKYSDWDIDYSVFEDVLKAGSSMEVYGTINHIIDCYNEHFEQYGKSWNNL